MHENGHDFRAFYVTAEKLFGARLSLDDWINGLQMRRIRHDRDSEMVTTKYSILGLLYCSLLLQSTHCGCLLLLFLFFFSRGPRLYMRVCPSVGRSVGR